VKKVHIITHIVKGKLKSVLIDFVQKQEEWYRNKYLTTRRRWTRNQRVWT